MSYIKVWECKLYFDVRMPNSHDCGLFALELTRLTERNDFKTPSK